MIANVYYSTVLVAMTCGVCHIPFAMPEDFYSAARKDGREFYCPNGHSLAYHKSENKKLQEEKAALERRVANLQDDVRVSRIERDQAERMRVARDAAAGQEQLPGTEATPGVQKGRVAVVDDEGAE